MTKKLLFCCSFVLIAAMAFAEADIRVLPHAWTLKIKGKGRVKAEIRNVDTSAVDLNSITMNGLAPLKTKANPRKVIAFFSKKDVLSTLGDLERGQVHEITVSFSIGNGPTEALNDTIRIAGKKKNNGPQNKPDTPGGPPANPGNGGKP